jgi:hypothetical protein
VPTDITLYRQPVNTIFDLLGDKENDITYSVGWALSQSDNLVAALLTDVLGRKAPPAADKVLLQEGISGAGYTDIEILAGEGLVHLIIEAKRGYNLPSTEQLTRYAERSKPRPTAMLVTAEAPPAYVQGRLPVEVAEVPVLYRSWRQIERLASECISARCGHAEKRLLRELTGYLRGLMTMQNIRSNLVYVVSLGREIEDTGITFREVVVDHDVYFCPVGGGPGGWPKEPPNYLGFRFDGQLQQIRHVEDYEVRNDDYAGFEPLRGKVHWPDDPHWLFGLGPVIQPQHEVRTGNLYRNQRVWAAIDLLLTSKSIAEARDLTRARLEAVGDTL